MTTKEYVKQLKYLGKKCHFHKGVWWQEVKPFYYWPADLFQTLDRQSKPALFKAFLGFEYLVSDKTQANSHLSILIIEKDALQNYTLENLLKKKRNQIKRGLENFQVKQIRDKKIIIRQGHCINQNALLRQERSSNIAKFYSSSAEWKKEITKNFNLSSREIWGAFRQNKLTAYIRTMTIENSIFITNAMSHSDYLSLYPNDALIYNFIIHKKQTEQNLHRITFGLYTAKESINKFKTQLGFQIIDYPNFRWLNPLIKPLLRFTKYKHYYAK